MDSCGRGYITQCKEVIPQCRRYATDRTKFHFKVSKRKEKVGFGEGARHDSPEKAFLKGCASPRSRPRGKLY